MLPSAGSAASLLLQQGGDVDVPADGLAVEAAGEQVARLVFLVPGCATNHPPVTLCDTHKSAFRSQTREVELSQLARRLSPSCCCGATGPASRRSCRTVAPGGCHGEER